MNTKVSFFISYFLCFFLLKQDDLYDKQEGLYETSRGY